MEHSLETIREFRTAQFRVVVDAIPEYDPDLSWDETGEVARKIDAGDFVLFCARVRVIHSTLGEIGSDYLGGCIYSSLDEFEDHRECAAQTRQLRAEGNSAVVGSYFADMIREAILDARLNIRAAQEIYVRAA